MSMRAKLNRESNWWEVCRIYKTRWTKDWRKTSKTLNSLKVWRFKKSRRSKRKEIRSCLERNRLKSEIWSERLRPRKLSILMNSITKSIQIYFIWSTNRNNLSECPITVNSILKAGSANTSRICLSLACKTMSLAKIQTKATKMREKKRKSKKSWMKL